MNTRVLATEWADQLVLAAEVRADRRRPWRHLDGEDAFVRLRRGVYLKAATWREADEDERMLWRIRAAAYDASEELVFSHLSAAAIWGLPMTSTWPSTPHVTVRGHRREGSTPQLTRTMVRDEFPVEQRGGLLLTSLARTVVDVARTQPLSIALPVVDKALGLDIGALDRNEIVDELSRATARGSAMAALAIGLGDGRSDSPGESLSRAAMHVCGFPAPELQVPFRDEHGLMIVDFYWPQQRLIGEFDGLGKYRRDELLRGRAPGDVVVAEKRREDRLRALDRRVTRWGWSTARSLPHFRRHLLGAGLEIERG